MNRRSFLSSFLAGAAAAIVAPQVVTHGLKLNFRRTQTLWVPNPEYETAPYYEVKFISDGYIGTYPPNMGNVLKPCDYDSGDFQETERRFLLTNTGLTEVLPFIRKVNL